MKHTDISIIVIFGKEEDVLERALNSAIWADELILVAANSNDLSKKLAEKYSKDMLEVKDEYGKHFARWRNLGLKKATGDWVFYLDADEVITPELKRSLLKIAAKKGPKEKYACYAVPRINHYLGQRVKYGGSYPDYVKRLFKRKRLIRWEGRLHEQPLVRGEMGKLKHHLLHYTHRDLSSMMEKTIRWTQLEAKALYESDHPPVVWWRILRMMTTKFFERVVKQQAWRDGTVGWINAIFEVFNTFIIYARLWEMQQKGLR
ncbi:MAG: glycosyltransferase family 2 protein [Patescibacteria group bacterium]|nr:glycosyltransferase family 2 protein [Patescibacteria group bacterium]